MKYARAYWSIFRIRAAECLQYRAAALAGAATSVAWALIEITVYSVFFRFSENASFAGREAGLTLRQAASYVWITQFLFLMQPMGIDSDILEKIESGDVGLDLCRPIGVYGHWFAKTAAARLSPLLWRGAPTLLAGILMPGIYRLSPPRGLGALAAALAGTLGAFLLCSSFAMLLHVIRMDVRWGNGPCYMISLVGGLLSGTYLPLQLWPKSMQRFLLLQPFAGYADLPARLYTGALAPTQAGWAVLLQTAWAAFFILIGRALMRARLKQIIVQGG